MVIHGAKQAIPGGIGFIQHGSDVCVVAGWIGVVFTTVAGWVGTELTTGGFTTEQKSKDLSNYSDDIK